MPELDHAHKHKIALLHGLLMSPFLHRDSSSDGSASTLLVVSKCAAPCHKACEFSE